MDRLSYYHIRFNFLGLLHVARRGEISLSEDEVYDIRCACDNVVRRVGLSRI